MRTAKCRIGVLGTGHLGRIHLKCIGLSEHCELVGHYDPSEVARQAAHDVSGQAALASAQAVIDAADAIVIVSPTTAHFDLAKQAMQAGKHVFIEKPVTSTVAQAEELLALQAEVNVHVQVGHVERFNPAYLSLQGVEMQPLFIEVHRLGAFSMRGTDVSVVLDLMIHDLDLLLHIVGQPVIDIQANGVAIMSGQPDIANARLTFADGCVANITASRISMKQMRKIRLFQSDAYISMDFLEKKAEVFKLEETPAADDFVGLTMPVETAQGERHIHAWQPTPPDVNSIVLELDSFAKSIAENHEPPVTLRAATEALRLAHRINQTILMSL